MIALKPCPFCGNAEPVLVTEIADWPSVVCSTSFGGCGASSGHCPAGRADAITAWNTRHDDPQWSITDAGRALIAGTD